MPVILSGVFEALCEPPLSEPCRLGSGRGQPGPSHRGCLKGRGRLGSVVTPWTDDRREPQHGTPRDRSRSSWRQGALQLEERTPSPRESLGLRKRDSLANQPVLGVEGPGGQSPPILSPELSLPQCPFTPDPSRRQGSLGLLGVQTCGDWIHGGSGVNPCAMQREHLLWKGPKCWIWVTVRMCCGCVYSV